MNGCLLHTTLGSSCNMGKCPDQESNSDPLVHRSTLNPLSHRLGAKFCCVACCWRGMSGDVHPLLLELWRLLVPLGFLAGEVCSLAPVAMQACSPHCPVLKALLGCVVRAGGRCEVGHVSTQLGPCWATSSARGDLGLRRRWSHGDVEAGVVVFHLLCAPHTTSSTRRAMRGRQASAGL